MMKSKVQISRRSFLGLTGSAGLFGLSGCAGFPAILSGRNLNSRVCHAAIGTGNQAWTDLQGFATHPNVEITALCDVDAAYLAAAKKSFPNARTYRNWRDLLSAEGDRLDSVNISTPDHQHAIMAVEAMRQGKHCYLEKPLCKTIGEARLLRRVAEETHVRTQMGTQWHAMDADRETVAVLRSGMLGPLEHAYLFSTRGAIARRRRTLAPISPVPETLDWKLWLGEAEGRPYRAGAYHPKMWRIWKDLGSGWIGDLCIHVFTSLWAGMDLGETMCREVVAEVLHDCEPGLEGLTWPNACHITWQFGGARVSGGNPFVVEWLDGIDQEGFDLAPASFRPNAEIDRLWRLTPIGKRPFEGKALKFAGGWLLQPHSDTLHAFIIRSGDIVEQAPTQPSRATHYHEFINSIGNGATCSTDFSWSTGMMEVVIAGETAERFPMRRLKWNAVDSSFGDAVVDRVLGLTQR